MRGAVLVAGCSAAGAVWLLVGGGAGPALRRLADALAKTSGPATALERPDVRRDMGEPRVRRHDRSGGPADGRVGRPALASGHPERLRTGRGSREGAQAEETLRELCTALAAELRAGRPAREALNRAAASGGDAAAMLIGRALAAARMGGDVAAAFRVDADGSGCPPLNWLAACWEIAEDSGAGLAVATDRLAEGLRLAAAQREEVAAQLAGVRASARLLAGLPVIGLMLGAGLGARPLEVLTGTPYGIACLIAGLALDGLGLLWVNRLAAAAQRPR